MMSSRLTSSGTRCCDEQASGPRMSEAGAAGAGAARGGGAADPERAALMIELGRFTDAIRVLGPVIAAAPGDGRAWCLLARARLGRQDLPAAISAARRASALDPAADWPYRIASTALVGLGKHGSAVAAAQQARVLAPQVWRTHLCLAQAAVAAGQHDLAAEAIRDALAIAPQEPDVQVAAGKVALGRGDLAAAAARQRAALALDPAHTGALNELGLISLRSKDPASAAGYFAQAARAEPGCAVFGRNAAVALTGMARLAAGQGVIIALLLAGAAACAVARLWFPGLLTTAGAGVAASRLAVSVARMPAPVRRRFAGLLRSGISPARTARPSRPGGGPPGPPARGQAK